MDTGLSKISDPAILIFYLSTHHTLLWVFMCTEHSQAVSKSTGYLILCTWLYEIRTSAPGPFLPSCAMAARCWAQGCLCAWGHVRRVDNNLRISSAFTSLRWAEVVLPGMLQSRQSWKILLCFDLSSPLAALALEPWQKVKALHSQVWSHPSDIPSLKYWYLQKTTW